jgi:hypothetical protein
MPSIDAQDRIYHLAYEVLSERFQCYRGDFSRTINWLGLGKSLLQTIEGRGMMKGLESITKCSFIQVQNLRASMNIVESLLSSRPT